MKKLILGACALSFAATVFAQGTVTFNNRVVGTIVTHVYNYDPANPAAYAAGYGANDFNPATGLPGSATWAGPALSGSGFSAQIYAAPGNSQAESSLVAASPITSFRTGAGAGFLAATTATLTGVPADAPAATLVLRVWDNAGGTINTWEAAKAAGTVATGESPLFNLSAIGGNLNTPPNLVGLQSFNLTIVPEPSTFALAGLGAAALLLFRRRK